MKRPTRLAVLLLAVCRGAAFAEEVTREEDVLLSELLMHGGTLEEFDKALLTHPDSAVLRTGKADILFLQGDVKAARKELEQAVNRRPRSFFACNDLLSVLLATGDENAARRTLHTAKEAGIPPYLKEEYAALESELDGDMKQAEAILKKAAAAGSDSASERLVEFYARRGRFSDTIAVIERSIGPQPWYVRRKRSGKMYFRKGAYLLAMGRHDNAYVVFRDILDEYGHIGTNPEVEYSYMLTTIMSNALGYKPVRMRANVESTTRSLLKARSRLSAGVPFSARVLGVFLGTSPAEQVLQELAAVRKNCPLFPGAERAGILLSCFFLMKANEARQGTAPGDLFARLLTSFGRAESVPVRLNWIRVFQ